MFLSGGENLCDLDPFDVEKFLVNSRNMEFLYHANSVRTACTFFSCGGLLSRGTVQDRNLLQTPQYTDELDQRYGIWYDIFLDSSDHHFRSRNVNYYGPVLFKLSLNVLTCLGIPNIRVTKYNPDKWDSIEPNERYFNDIGELEKSYSRGDFGQIITLRETREVLGFENCLTEIIIDDPQIDYYGINLFNQAFDAIQCAAMDGRVNVNITRRNCGVSCRCTSYYTSSRVDLERLFFP